MDNRKRYGGAMSPANHVDTPIRPIMSGAAPEFQKLRDASQSIERGDYGGYMDIMEVAPEGSPEDNALDKARLRGQPGQSSFRRGDGVC